MKKIKDTKKKRRPSKGLLFWIAWIAIAILCGIGVGYIYMQYEIGLESTEAPEAGVEISQTAKRYVEESSKTYRYDGDPESLEIVDAGTFSAECECYEVVVKFTSSHAGYGDRKGQTVAQAITEHQAHVFVSMENRVLSANLDNEWDIAGQKPLSPL